MNAIFTGLLVVASCGFIACTNQVDGSDADDPSDNASLAASGNPDKNGLDTYKVTHASILVDKTIANSLVTHPLRIATNGANGLTQAVLGAICDGTHESLETFRYITKCALAKDTHIVYTCPGGGHATQTFNGYFGLAEGWGDTNGVCAEGGCQEWVSACVLAHSSFAGEIGVQLQLTGSHAKLNQGHDVDYTDDEGAYWGDIFNQSGAGQKRYGCQGTNATAKYSSPAQGGSKDLLSRTCGYFNSYSSCDFCSGTTSVYSGNQCTGTHAHYLNNLNPANSPATVRSCSLLCGADVSTDWGHYDSCTTNGSGAASSKVITVWRK